MNSITIIRIQLKMTKNSNSILLRIVRVPEISYYPRPSSVRPFFWDNHKAIERTFDNKLHLLHSAKGHASLANMSNSFNESNSFSQCNF